MKTPTRLLILAAIVAPAVTFASDPGAAQPTTLELALKTREARLSGDNARWLELGREVQARAPDHVDLLISLGRAHAANGRIAEAVAWLDQAVARGAGFDLSAFPEFKDRAGDAAFAPLAARAAANLVPVSPPTEFLVIENPDIRPEGIAWDADASRLLIGSLGGEIWSVGLDRKLARFAGPDAGLREVLGLKVDRGRRLLWAVTGVFPDLFPSPAGPKPDVGLTGVVAFNLESGARVRECWLDERPVLHGFNDLALAANGDVYASDTAANAIWRLPGGECRLDKVIQDSRMSAPNGIALSTDESRLYVAHIEGLSAVDLRAGGRTQLPVPANATVNSMDGLVREGEDLIGIQATPYLARVLRIRLSDDGFAVREVTTVSSRPPPGVNQTTGTVAGAHYYSVAGTIDPLQSGGGDQRARILQAQLAPPATTQAKPDVLVKQRQAAMTLQGKYFGPLFGMLRGSIPFDAEVVARNARYLDALSAMPWDGFPESTQGEASRALASVWIEQAKFRRMIGEFESAVDALVAASSGARERDIRPAIEGVGKSCGGCHDAFRRK